LSKYAVLNSKAAINIRFHLLHRKSGIIIPSSNHFSKAIINDHGSTSQLIIKHWCPGKSPHGKPLEILQSFRYKDILYEQNHDRQELSRHFTWCRLEYENSRFRLFNGYPQYIVELTIETALMNYPAASCEVSIVKKTHLLPMYLLIFLLAALLSNILTRQFNM
jgi:hypothetical protein